MMADGSQGTSSVFCFSGRKLSWTVLQMHWITAGLQLSLKWKQPHLLWRLLTTSIRVLGDTLLASFESFQSEIQRFKFDALAQFLTRSQMERTSFPLAKILAKIISKTHLLLLQNGTLLLCCSEYWSYSKSLNVLMLYFVDVPFSFANVTATWTKTLAQQWNYPCMHLPLHWITSA